MWLYYYFFVKYIEYIAVRILVVERLAGQRKSSNTHGQAILKPEFDGQVMANRARSRK